MKNLTDFQKSVLKMVKKIPRGQVVTYQEVARAVGRPKAGRAVGNALKKNPRLIKIPCHRVIKSNGQVGGYVAGVPKKVKLLKKEGVMFENLKIIKFKN